MNSTVALPAIITPALLTSIRNRPHLPRHTWYFIAATTLCQLNRPDEIPKVYQHALEYESGHEVTNANVVAEPDGSEPALTHQDQLAISRRMREALVKAAAVGGAPRVNSMQYLRQRQSGKPLAD